MSVKENFIEVKKNIYSGAETAAININNIRRKILYNMRNADREQFLNFLFSKNFLILIIILIVCIMFYYFYYWSAILRIPRMLRNFDSIINLVNPKQFSGCNIDLDKFRLCDFYVASSSKSYLIGQQTSDYVSKNALTKVIQSGARMIELDIFNETFDEYTEPIVANGIEEGRFLETYNYITFEECCKTLSECAFSRILISNSSDPLFLYLNLHVNGNLKTLDRVAEIITSYFGGSNDKLLPMCYSYQKINIPQTKLKNLFGKIVILASPGFKNSKLDELVNYSPEKYYMRKYSYDEIENAYEPNEITNFNKRYITIVDAEDDIASINKSPSLPWSYGCQFVGMNYQSEDMGLFEYLKKFNDYSFSLKPEELRYKPLLYKAPKKQNKKVSLSNMELSTPFYKAKI